MASTKSHTNCGKRGSMQILPINTYNQNIYYKKQKGQNITFCDHPDFTALQRKYDITASIFFRRGGYYGGPNKAFADVIDTLKLFFNRQTKNQVSMLIGGIAESQEPYSMLAVIKNLIGKKKFKKVLDLHTIDLQSKPSEDALFLQSFYDCPWKPEYATESFEREETIDYGHEHMGSYRVKPDIYKYLSSVYNNPEKAKWETRIQDSIKEYPDETFDIISVNNTLIYIFDYALRIKTVKDIFDKLKPNGVFITDPHMTEYQEVFSPDVCDEIYPGIYRKNGELSIKEQFAEASRLLQYLTGRKE